MSPKWNTSRLRLDGHLHGANFSIEQACRAVGQPLGDVETMPVASHGFPTIEVNNFLEIKI